MPRFPDSMELRSKNVHHPMSIAVARIEDGVLQSKKVPRPVSTAVAGIEGGLRSQKGTVKKEKVEKDLVSECLVSEFSVPGQLNHRRFPLVHIAEASLPKGGSLFYPLPREPYESHVSIDFTEPGRW